MTDTPNPYTPPAETGNGASRPAQGEPLDFPHGLLTPLGIAVVGGLMVCGFFLLLDNGQTLPPGFLFLCALGTWNLSFVFVGGLLPGTSSRRIGRAVFGFALSFPALILYVPVCGIILATSGGQGGSEIPLIVSTMTAFISVLLLFALVMRGSARALNPISSPIPAPADDPDSDELFKN